MTAPAIPAALEARGLAKNFGALAVTRNVSLTLAPGARHALIGPNGAGKTTLINLLTGALRPTGGAVLIGGRDVTGFSQANRVKLGLARTFQINTLFAGLSVLENLCLAIAERKGAARDMFRPMACRTDIIDEAMECLRHLRMADDAARPVRELPYGRQRLVEIGIALGLEPRVLLLDEPAAGVPSAETGILIEAIERLPADIAVLIIEHDMELVFRFARRITVLVAGAVLVEGPPSEIALNEDVRAVYLGSTMDGR